MLRLCVLGRLAEEEELRVAPEERYVVEEPEVRGAVAVVLRPLAEEERTTPFPETWPAEALRATLLAEERVRVAAAERAAEELVRVAAEEEDRVAAAEGRVAAREEVALLLRVDRPLLLRDAELLRLERPPMASVLRWCVRLLVPK